MIFFINTLSLDFHKFGTVFNNITVTKLKIMSTLITVLITLVVVGLILYLINRFIPMASSIKSILNVVVIIAVIIWLLRVFGIWGGTGTI